MNFWNLTVWLAQLFIKIKIMIVAVWEFIVLDKLPFGSPTESEKKDGKF
jgi:hypothetical protein